MAGALKENGALREHGGVLALGSGAVLDEAVQHLLNGLPVVFLSASFDTVARRIGLDRPRVVVPGNPRGRLRAMLDERDALYRRLASVTVPTDDLDLDEVADAGRREAEGMTATRIGSLRPTAASLTTSWSASACSASCPAWSPKDARTVVVIHAESLGEIARPACGALRAAGLTVYAEPVPDGEAAKTVDVAASCGRGLPSTA